MMAKEPNTSTKTTRWSRALGLSIPTVILAGADEIIE